MKENLHHGSNLDFNPLSNDASIQHPPQPQSQQWPGTEQHMEPRADHGENSYMGGGKLQGKVALITGGDSGIGRAVAIAYAREGADVVISYFNEHEDAQDTVHWVEKAGRHCMALSGDIRDPQFCHNLVERSVRKFGGINILVNNAAIHIEKKDFMEITPEQLDQTFQTNIMSFFWTTQATLSQMKAGDSIINVGSVVAMMGYPQLIDYSCTKAAIHNLTYSLAQQLAPKGIRVNCVAPGPVWTPLIPSTRERKEVEQFGSESLWGRPAQPAEIAPSFVFLASSDSRYYTGEIIAPTGMPVTSR
ncbi:SDR family oxidoreductase [Chitinispirillales bacterium ANBcel5]|uniref:SDR family oxidoreductase n=1 Tax=Cellulosispirillum alkaliphilum TaxID=3039283 RepID=UPI002A50F456|nr:SDR family oxidoreductase [Chitinispirillales bacterium ANBcel5]